MTDQTTPGATPATITATEIMRGLFDALAAEDKAMSQLADFQDFKRRVIASVKVCETVSTANLETMPAGGVHGMAMQLASLYVSLEAVQKAAKSDENWAAMRAGLLSKPGPAVTTH